MEYGEPVTSTEMNTLSELSPTDRKVHEKYDMLTQAGRYNYSSQLERRLDTVYKHSPRIKRCYNLSNSFSSQEGRWSRKYSARPLSCACSSNKSARTRKGRLIQPAKLMHLTSSDVLLQRSCAAQDITSDSSGLQSWSEMLEALVDTPTADAGSCSSSFSTPSLSNSSVSSLNTKLYTTDDCTNSQSDSVGPLVSQKSIKTCSQEAVEEVQPPQSEQLDLVSDQLSYYFEEVVRMPKQMSFMAEMMYT